MALSITNERAERLAREFAAIRGDTITSALTYALEEALLRATGRLPEERVAAVGALLDELDRLPVFDARSADELLGYDDDGLVD